MIIAQDSRFIHVIVRAVLDDKDDVDCLPLEENKNECSKLG